jgi:hypothetical protein
MKKATKLQTGVDELQGWQEIAAFLGQPVAVAQRWARSEGMPAERRGRYVYASREKLNQWLGRESSGEPLQISTDDTDLGAELKRGLSFVRKKKRGHTRAA